MKNTFRKGLVLLMVLCMLVPIFGTAALAADTDDGALPLDYQFEEVRSTDAPAGSVKMTNDPYSARQWGMKMIGMEQAWRSGLTGEGVRVGIIDSGLSTNTMDIDQNRIEEGVNLGSIRINIGSPTADSEGHGTFIAGIIGATKDNNIGIAGVAPKVTFVPIKIFSGLVTSSGSEAKAVYAAVDDYHCDVLNLSFGTTSDLKALHTAIQYAVSKGVIVVSTVGNEGDGTVNYPGAYPEVVCVGSVGSSGSVSDFSNKNQTVDVVAPGENVTSLGRTPMYVYSSSGTSFSAPFVAGAAALLKQAMPNMTHEQFMDILEHSCRDIGDPGRDIESGFGLLQVPEALRYAAEKYGFALDDMTVPAEPEEPDEPGSSWSIADLFNLNWLRDFFQNTIGSIIRNLFKGFSF